MVCGSYAKSNFFCYIRSSIFFCTSLSQAQGFIQDFFLRGGNVHVAAAIVSVCVNTPYLGGSGGMPPPPPMKFFLFNLQFLRQFLVAPETHTPFGLLVHVVGKAT